MGYGDRYLLLTKWNEEDRVDIREWTDDGERVFPTKKGVSLPLTRWKALLEFKEDVVKAVKEKADYDIHIGGNVCVKVSQKYPFRVDIRQYFLPDGDVEPVPTKRGISLLWGEWKDVIDCISYLEELCPPLKSIVPCFLSEDHQAQLGMLRCPECTPNGYLQV